MSIPNRSVSRPQHPTAVVYCEANFGSMDGKTANGLVRHSEKFKILSVIDSTKAGMDAGAVLDKITNGIPIHSDLATALEHTDGMSDIYLPDDLIWSNKNTGATLRPQLLRMNTMSAGELNNLAKMFTKLGLSDLQPISDVIGVLFEEGSVWHTLRVGELKGMLALATGNLEEAESWCSWCSHFYFLPPARKNLYRAIHELTNLKLSDENPAQYDTALSLFFDEKTLIDARNIVAGTQTFHGLTFSERWEKISPLHQQFIGIYQRLHPLKAG